jgi:uridine kinase
MRLRGRTSVTESGGRGELIDRIADHLLAHRPGHPLRVAVDGITAAGKTTFAGELAAAVAVRGRPVARVSMDGYHHPRAHRHRQGRDSADGYYQDAYDFPAFAKLVLDPLGAGGRYRPAIIDLATDTPVSPQQIQLASDAVLIVDGSFLQRAELAGRWDEVVFLQTGFAAARGRGANRDATAFGGVEQAGHAFDNRYHAACRRYLDEVDPATHASILVDHEQPTEPRLIRIGGECRD